MKKNILAIIFMFCFQFGVFSQNNNPIDLILLLNISADMGSSYENVSNYITGPFLSEYLRVGDTFHLITFSAASRLDSARRISDTGDVETIIGRMFLQYPVENGSNMTTAISFTEQYITTLPLRSKKIVVVSTGSPEINNLINTAKQRFGQANTTLDFVQVTPGQPLTGLPSSGRAPSPAAGTASQGTTPQTTQTTSPATGTAAQGTTAPASSSQGTDALSTTETASSIPSSAPQATNSASQADSVQNTPSPVAAQTDSSPGGQQSVSQPVQRTTGTGFSFHIPLIIVGIAALLILIIFIIFIASRKLRSSPNRVMAEVSKSGNNRDEAKIVNNNKDLAKYAAVQPRQRTTPYSDRPVKSENVQPPKINPTGPLLLNMFVEDQNTLIGKRNIHSLKSGYSLTIGGGKSDFLIFLVPVPANIGEVRRSGSQLTFIPRKSKFFPDLGSSELRDCLNKTVRIISDKGYELRFRFEMYEDPLETLNRVLLQIKVPG